MPPAGDGGVRCAVCGAVDGAPPPVCALPVPEPCTPTPPSCCQPPTPPLFVQMIGVMLHACTVIGAGPLNTNCAWYSLAGCGSSPGQSPGNASPGAHAVAFVAPSVFESARNCWKPAAERGRLSELASCAKSPDATLTRTPSPGLMTVPVLARVQVAGVGATWPTPPWVEAPGVAPWSTTVTVSATPPGPVMLVAPAGEVPT